MTFYIIEKGIYHLPTYKYTYLNFKCFSFRIVENLQMHSWHLFISNCMKLSEDGLINNLNASLLSPKTTCIPTLSPFRIFLSSFYIALFSGYNLFLLCFPYLFFLSHSLIVAFCHLFILFHCHIVPLFSHFLCFYLSISHFTPSICYSSPMSHFLEINNLI